MTKFKEAEFTKDLENKKLIVLRDFEAPVDQVWEAWTDQALLDSWWAPRPWKARTKTFDFRPGGVWLYAMVGPDGSEAWCRVDYKSVTPQKEFTANDSFCDAEGNVVPEPPGMHWKSEFTPSDTGTTVRVEITFASESDMDKIVKMGFKEGFSAGLNNLEELLSAKATS